MAAIEWALQKSTASTKQALTTWDAQLEGVAIGMAEIMPDYYAGLGGSLSTSKLSCEDSIQHGAWALKH